MEKKIRFLILEDLPEDAKLMERELSRAGMAFLSKMVEARDDFIRELEEFAPDLIIADYNLPSFDGLAALAICKELCPEVPFIFVSGTVGEEFAIETLKQGATDYVLKDRLSRLGLSVKRALRESEERARQKQTQDWLRETNETLGTIIQASPLAIIALDEDGRVKIWSPAAEQIFGWSEKEVLGLRLPIVPEDKENEFRSLLQKIFQGEVYTGADTRRLKKNGSLIDVSISAAPFHDHRGKIVGTIGLMEDITRRKQAEETLQKSEQEAKQLAKENALMAEIGRIVSSTMNIEEIYEHFADEVRKIIPFDRIAIDIINPEEGKVLIPYVSGVDIPGYAKGCVFALSGSMTERAAQSRSGLIFQVEDGGAKAEEEIKALFPGFLSNYRAGLRSLMMVPLISKDQAIAALHIQSLKIKAYTEGDLIIAEKIGNQIAGAIANAQLFVERKQAEDGLRRGKDRAQKYLDIAGVTLVAIDLDQKVSLINRKGCQLLGYTEEEIIGKKWFEDFLPERVRESVRAVFAQLVAGEDGRGEYVENPILTKNGEERVVAWHNTILTDEGGKITATFSSGEDITERKRAEDAIRKSETKYRKLHESMVDGFVFASMDGMIQEYNQSFMEMLGYTAEEILKLTYRDLTPEKWHTFEQKIVEEQILPRGYSEVYEKEYRKKDGTEFPVELRTFLIKDETGSNLGMWAIVRDIIERKRVEKKIKESLREKEVLLKEIHHRVKNNLQVISSLLNWQSRYIQDPSALEMFKESQNRVKSMALIHEKLYQSKDLAKINFGQYVQSLSDHIFRSYQTGSKEVSLQIDIQDIILGIDKAIPCGMVINELISNSFKHAFPASNHGEISLSLKPNEEGRLILTVKDNGTGLPQNYDFRSAESIGMQLVNILTSQMGGTIELDRQQGTEFRITFPAE